MTPRRLQGEDGMVTAFVTILTVAIIFVTGLVLDGGYVLAAKREANNVAEQAARAGAQHVSEDALRGSGEFRLDDGAAVGAAEAFLARRGHRGDARVEGESVIVTVEIDRPLLILGAAGMADVVVTGTGTARPVFGVDAAEN
ncbi:MAG TPA: pilus assembly protein TadG-related protein [Acidimicrobiales bacterium]